MMTRFEYIKAIKGLIGHTASHLLKSYRQTFFIIEISTFFITKNGTKP